MAAETKILAWWKKQAMKVIYELEEVYEVYLLYNIKAHKPI